MVEKCKLTKMEFTVSFQAYGETHFHDIDLAPVDGKKLVKEMAENLGAVLGKKMDALRVST